MTPVVAADWARSTAGMWRVIAFLSWRMSVVKATATDNRLVTSTLYAAPNPAVYFYSCNCTKSAKLSWNINISTTCSEKHARGSIRHSSLQHQKKTLPIFQMSSPEYWHWRKTTNYVNYLGLEYRGCCRLTCQNCGQTCRLYAVSWHEADPVATDWPWTETLQQKTFHHKHINNLLVWAIKITMHGYHLVIIKLKITECQWSSMPALQLQKHLTPVTMLQPVDMIMIHLTVGC